MARLGIVDLRTDPGDAYLYINARARLIGLVLERVYGAPYPDLIRQRIPSRIGAPDFRCGSSADDHGRLAVSEQTTTTCDGASGAARICIGHGPLSDALPGQHGCGRQSGEEAAVPAG